MKKTKPSFSLKDKLFNKQKVEYISGLIKNVYPDFLSEKFENEVLDKFPELELKQRIFHISDMFRKYIWDKNDYKKTVNILLKSLPELDENWTLDNNFGDFIFCPYSLFVAENWCKEKYLGFSFSALEKITSRFSAEESIRFFLNKFEKQTFEKMLEWSKSENYHLRRLSSEGSRQKLPWCQKINLDYKKTIKILDNLYTDKSRFVTRSVANHLNDISKIDVDLVIDVLERWKKNNLNIKSGQTQGTAPTDCRGEPCVHPDKNDLDYIISHSTRSLVKMWDKRTLEFLGYSSNPKIEINNFEIKNNVIKIWESLEFSFDINSKKSENLIIDYKIYFLNKAWKLLPKVFKIKKVENAGLHSLQINKKHKLQIMSTKALYAWKHFIEIIINWKSFWKKEFELKI